MKLFIVVLVFLLILSCTRRVEKSSESCTEIIESDSFYFALPMDQEQYRAMYRLENYLAQVTHSKVQSIGFDCAVVISPNNEQLDSLREVFGHDFDENVKINTKHLDAVRCMMESRGILTLTGTEQFVRFISTHETWELDVRRGIFPDWKFILFKNGKDPLILPAVAVTLEKVEEYFANKE